MAAKLIIILSYLSATFVVGLIFRKRAARSGEEFFLAGRGLPRVLLFFTMAATNFSAFTIFGLSGAGYRMGYAFYPIMGFGTGFMALSFYVIGGRILVLSRDRGYITPSDFIDDRYGSRVLKLVFSGVLVVFTLPYIAIQAIASGRSLHSLIGLPYAVGALLVTAFVVLYVTLGGMRSIVWTDLIQGVMMVAFALIAFGLIASRSGGFVQIHEGLAVTNPDHLMRPGAGGGLLPGVWIGYLVLWFFADPMFPQLFQRFMAAKDERALKTTIVLYPLITTLLFFLTVSIGVMGRAAFPNLSGSESDSIFALLLGRYAGVFLGTLLLTGGIAALMSTMDSQLLTLTSIITRDFVTPRRRRTWVERAVVIALGALGLLIALRPPETILGFINKTTFNGLSVLAPTVIGGLYWKRANFRGALASIVTGEILVVLVYAGIVQVPAIHPILIILGVSAAVFVGVCALTPRAGGSPEIVAPVKLHPGWTAVFALLFVLGNDFWAWHRPPVLVAGLPLWVWYYVALGVILSLAYKLFLRSRSFR